MNAHHQRALRLLLVLLVTGALLALAAHGHERTGDDAHCVLCILAAGLILPLAFIALSGILVTDPERIRILPRDQQFTCSFAPCGLRAPPASH